MNANSAAELAALDAVGQAALVAAGDLTAAELLEAAILRVEATRALNAVITDLFDRGTVAGLGERFVQVLAEVLADPGRSVASVGVLLPAERERLYAGWKKAVERTRGWAEP